MAVERGVSIAERELVSALAKETANIKRLRQKTKGKKNKSYTVTIYTGKKSKPIPYFIDASTQEEAIAYARKGMLEDYGKIHSIMSVDETTAETKAKYPYIFEKSKYGTWYSLWSTGKSLSNPGAAYHKDQLEHLKRQKYGFNSDAEVSFHQGKIAAHESSIEAIDRGIPNPKRRSQRNPISKTNKKLLTTIIVATVVSLLPIFPAPIGQVEGRKQNFWDWLKYKI